MKRKTLTPLILLSCVALSGATFGLAYWIIPFAIDSNPASRIIYKVEFDGYKDSDDNNIVYIPLEKDTEFDLPQLDDHSNEHFLGWYVNGCSSMDIVSGRTSFNTLLSSAITANSSYNLITTTSGNVTTKQMTLKSKYGLKSGYTLFTVTANSGVSMSTYYHISPTINRFYLFSLNPTVANYHLVSYTYATPIAKWDKDGVLVSAPGSGSTTIYPDESISLTGLTSINLVANFASN